MNRRIIFGILLALVLLAGAAAVGVTAYQAGMARGLADSGKLVLPGGDGLAPQGGAPVYPYYGFYGHRPFGFGPFGWGFGFLQCLFPLLFLFLLFGLLRGLFWWGRPWGRGWVGHHHGEHGPWGRGAPPMFEEWHKRAHGEQPTPPQEPPQS